TPVPAKTSKNGRPGTASPRMLNSASRTICGVGRRPGCTVQLSLRPRNDPATMRICVRMACIQTENTREQSTSPGGWQEKSRETRGLLPPQKDIIGHFQVQHVRHSTEALLQSQCLEVSLQPG